MKGPDEVTIKYALRLAFKAANNMAAYEALAKGLDLVRKIKPRMLNIYNDSQLVIGQVST